MFDIGFLELAVILVLALLVLGPERLPKAARTVGYWFGKARRYVEGMKSQVEAEFDSTEVKRLLRNQEVQIRELQNKLQNADDYIDTEYHNQFENTDDPGTDIAETNKSDLQEEKPSMPQYDIIEEDDEQWGQLQENNPVKEKIAKEKMSDEKQSEENINASSNTSALSDKTQ